ncbi:MAG: hypothetical protein KJ847_05365 [Firmicutes bacterium]|nr:hypothetical protein [Bacillota bacterium]
MSNKIKIKAPKDKSNSTTSTEKTTGGSKISSLKSGNSKFNSLNQTKKITKSFATKKK